MVDLQRLQDARQRMLQFEEGREPDFAGWYTASKDLEEAVDALLASSQTVPREWQDMAVLPPERTVLELAWRHPSWTGWRLTLAEFVRGDEGWYWVYEHDPARWVVEDDQNDFLFLWKIPALPTPPQSDTCQEEGGQ